MEGFIICHSDSIEMRRKRYCCDASRQMYEDYYTGQVGGNMPVFPGARYQRGHGLGNVIGGLFRRVVLPFLRTSAKNVLPFLKKEQKDAHQKCVENWNGSGRRRTGRRISEIVREEARTPRYKTHCW